MKRLSLPHLDLLRCDDSGQLLDPVTGVNPMLMQQECLARLEIKLGGNSSPSKVSISLTPSPCSTSRESWPLGRVALPRAAETCRLMRPVVEPRLGSEWHVVEQIDIGRVEAAMGVVRDEVASGQPCLHFDQAFPVGLIIGCLDALVVVRLVQ